MNYVQAIPTAPILVGSAIWGEAISIVAAILLVILLAGSVIWTIVAGIKSAICWGYLLARLIAVDKTWVAVLFFATSIFGGYVISYIYGWGKADIYDTRKIMIEWTHCLKHFFCALSAATISFGIIYAMSQQ